MRHERTLERLQRGQNDWDRGHGTKWEGSRDQLAQGLAGSRVRAAFHFGFGVISASGASLHPGPGALWGHGSRERYWIGAYYS